MPRLESIPQPARNEQPQSSYVDVDALRQQNLERLKRGEATGADTTRESIRDLDVNQAAMEVMADRGQIFSAEEFRREANSLWRSKREEIEAARSQKDGRRASEIKRSTKGLLAKLLERALSADVMVKKAALEQVKRIADDIDKM